MGRPINDRFLGDFNEPGFQISAVVHVDAGEGVEPGYILRQRSNNKYLVEGVNSGAQAICRLVAALAPDLGEMSVSVLSDVKGLALLKDSQDETDYDGAGDNGTFVGGTGYDGGDTITLSDGSVITVDAISADLQVINGQDEENYNNAGNNGTFAAGADYIVGEVITLSNGTQVTVDDIDVGSNDEITEFTVTAIGSPTTAGTTLTQASSTGAGTGFTLTVESANLEDVEDITEFTVTSVGDVFAAGGTLTQTSTDGSGTGFTLTPGVANRDAKPEFARIINNRTVKTFLGNVYAWPERVDAVSRNTVDIQGE